jgi:DNA-binding MarR family transcriptional regulator
MKEIHPQQTIFYAIEQSIKEYRKYAQNQISKTVSNITLDQALVLLVIDNKNIEHSQTELSQILFKDFASMTRMIELMVKNGFIQRLENKIDRRKTSLKLTSKGNVTIKKLTPIIFQNRTIALEGISEIELNNLKLTLNKITNNCKNNSK